MKPWRTVAGLVAIAAATAFTAAPALAAEVTLSTPDDGTTLGTLRYVVNNAAAGETITFAPGVNPVLTGAQIDIPNTLTLSGNGTGAGGTTITGNTSDRVFTTSLGAMETATFNALRITNGHAPDGTGDGGIGGFGGAISANGGSLVLDGVELFGNVAGNGSRGNDGADASMIGIGGLGHPGGTGGGGGAVSATGALTVRDSSIHDNVAGNGGRAGDGGDGAGGFSGGAGGTGGVGGTGGGIVYFGVPAEITDTTFAANHAGAGGTGGDGGSGNGFQADGGDGGLGGVGGGVDQGPITLMSISRSTFAGNVAGAGGTGGGSTFAPGTGGKGGDGGGLRALGGTVLNSTFDANQGGAGGQGGAGALGAPGGEGGGGGGISTTPNVSASTIAGNSAGLGGPGGTGGMAGAMGADGDGGGILLTSSRPIEASIVALNSASGSQADPQANCGGTAPTGSFDLSFPGGTGCPGLVGNPLLAALADNGGPTRTRALGAGSPARDQVPVGASCPATDQRGVGRPLGTACDIGAFEATPVPPVTPTAAANNPAATKKCKKKKKKRGKKKRCKKKKKRR